MTSNINIPPEDCNNTLNGYTRWKSLGQFKANESFTIYLDSTIGTSNEQREAYWHERTHLQLYTSTAFGHVQQLFTSIVVATKESDVPEIHIHALQKFVSLLYETSWEVHEGSATITPYLLKKPFSSSLISPGFYSDMPSRYANSSSMIATAVGAVLPMQLASYGFIGVNAIAQYCLNTNIITYATKYLNGIDNAGQGNSYSMFGYISNSINNPSCRLYKLISELYNDESNRVPTAIYDLFLRLIIRFDFVKSLPDGGVKIETDSIQQQLQIQDCLNFCILSILDVHLPNTLKYKRVVEMKYDLDLMYKAAEENIFCKIIRNDISEDIDKRAELEPVVREL